MLDIISEFSRAHCIAICAVLVPANLLATLQTLIFTGLRRPQVQVRVTAGIASIYALVMVFHVLSWFAIGVVMAPTYILLSKGCLCLAINFWAAFRSPLRDCPEDCEVSLSGQWSMDFGLGGGLWTWERVGVTLSRVPLGAIALVRKTLLS